MRRLEKSNSKFKESTIIVGLLIAIGVSYHYLQIAETIR